ncbi:hypothetical protein [Alistipes onderdonkii]|uniref:hypothetical protein n=1 Tax=Alistipes onderdonkii TaxID=328813 RepID=UPI0012E2E0D0|nr:hypothetical protein [Alistipes onderdonkii]
MGCIIDLALIVLACVYPWMLVFLLPYWAYQFIMRLKEYRYLKKMDDFLEKELKSIPLEKIEEKREHPTIIKKISVESNRLVISKIYADSIDFAEPRTLNWIECVLIIVFLLMSLYAFVSEVLN